MISRSTSARIKLTLIAAIAAGCAGGGGSSPAPVQVTAPQSVLVQFSINVPGLSSKARQPAYISASTKSATISVTPGSASTIVNCTSVCSGQILAPIGSDTFTVKLFDATNGTGNLLATGTLTQTIVIDQANSVTVTFNGVAVSLAISLNPTSVTIGTPKTGGSAIAVTVNALDADGNIIVGPGAYVDTNGNPLTLTLHDSDVSGATQLSQTTLTQPTTGITLSYNGNSISSPTISVTAPNLTTQQAILTVNAAATPTPSPSPTASPSPTPSPSPSPTPSASPTQSPGGVPLQRFGSFLGSTNTFTVTSSGGSGSLTAASRHPLGARSLKYQGYTLSATFGSNNASQSFSVTVTDATGNGDINSPFTAWPGPLTPFLYLDVLSNGSQDVTFAQAPAISITSTNGFPGINCSWGAYAWNGSASVWTTLSGNANPSGNTVSWPAFTISGFDLAPGVHNYVAFVCQSQPAQTSLVYLANRNSGNILAYPANGNGNLTPTINITGAATGIQNPVGFALDLSGNIYAANDSGTSIMIFPAGSNGNVPPTILGGADSLIGPAEGIHVDKNGTIYVSSFGSNDVAIFPAGSYGDAIPTRFIQGGLTGLAGPVGLTTDANLNLWVANSGGSIVEFAPNASGNATPLGIIPANATTTLIEPESVSIDSNGRLVVGDYGDGTVKIFAAGATGTVAPVQVIISGLGTLTAGLDASNKIYAIGPSANILNVYAASASGSATPLNAISGGSTLINDAWFPRVF
jgi:hypothetical protein